LYIFVGDEPKYFPARVMQVVKNIIARKSLKNIMKLRKGYLMMKFGLRVVTY
jgi:hypothetical protein